MNRVRIKLINGSFLINLMVYIKLNKDREMEFQILYFELICVKPYALRFKLIAVPPVQ